MFFLAVKRYFSVTQRKKSDKNHDVRVEVCGFFGNRSRLLKSQLGQLISGFTMALYRPEKAAGFDQHSLYS